MSFFMPKEAHGEMEKMTLPLHSSLILVIYLITEEFNNSLIIKSVDAILSGSRKNLDSVR